MELQKFVLSRAVNWITFAVEKNLKLLAFAGDDGTVLIFSHDDTILFEDKKENIKQLYFLSKKGSLIGFGNEPGLHMWNINEQTELFVYNFLEMDLNLEVKITSIYELQRNDSNETYDSNLNILIGYSNSTIELCAINENRVVRSNAVELNNFNGIIRQLLDISYEDEVLVLLLLVNQSLIKLECFASCKSDGDPELFSIFLQINHIISIFRKEYQINHFEVIDNQIIISTETGKYGIFNSSETLLENDIELKYNILEFPYGPFPCKPINKCLETTFSSIKGKCFVFSGGLPEVTYKDVNAVSVAVNHEPEICFTFNDAVIDFTVITHDSNDTNEIVVLTKTEYISITYQNGMWNSCYKNQIRPISQNQITGMSNSIEIKKFLINEPSNASVDKKNEQIKISKSVKLFALSNDDNTVSTWILTPDHYFLHETVNLSRFYKESEIQKLEKVAPWPKFMKCGNWKTHVQETFSVELMKIFYESNGQINLLISTNRQSIFLFKICLQFDCKLINKSQYKQWSHHHVSINDSTADNDVSTINNSANNNSDDLYLITLITFNDKIDPLILDFNINQDIISFAGSFGIGSIEIITGKHLFLPQCVFKIGEKTGQFSNLIEKNIRKRKLIEYPLSKIKCEENFPSNLFKPQSMILWQIDSKKFGVFLGLENGSILNINFVLDENLDFCVENVFRRLFTNTIHKIISVQLIEIETQFLETYKYRTLNQLNFDNSFETVNQTSENSIDTNASQETKSIYTTDGYSSFKDIISRRSLRTKFRPRQVKNKTFLLRVEQYSIKMIEYSKMKTLFKFKINNYLNNSNTSKKKTKSSVDSSEPIISESRIFKRDRIITRWFCFLLLSDKSIIELSVPNLIPLKTIDFRSLDFEYKLISIDFDMMLISENRTACSQLILLGNNNYRTCKPLLEHTIDKNKCQIDNDKKIINNDTSILDFMKEAKKSLYSLCGEN